MLIWKSIEMCLIWWIKCQYSHTPKHRKYCNFNIVMEKYLIMLINMEQIRYLNLAFKGWFTCLLFNSKLLICSCRGIILFFNWAIWCSCRNLCLSNTSTLSWFSSNWFSCNWEHLIRITKLTNIYILLLWQIIF